MEKHCLPQLDKRFFFDSETTLKTFEGSRNSSFDLSDQLHSNCHIYKSNHSQEYISGLEMKLEDIRSYIVEKSPYQKLSSLISSSFESPDQGEKAASSLLKNPLLQDSSLLKLSSLEKINDYFFNNFELIDSMERQFKQKLDQNYVTGRYKHELKALFSGDSSDLENHKASHNFESGKLESERKELEKMKLKLKEKKEKLKIERKKHEEDSENLKKQILEFEEKSEEIKKESFRLEIEKIKLQEDIAEYENKKYTETSSDNSKNQSVCLTTDAPASPSPVDYLNSFNSMIEHIKLSLESKSPAEIAAEIIDNIKSTIKAHQDFTNIDKIELKCMINTWEVRNKALVKSELLRKNDILLAQRAVDMELIKVKNFVDKKSKIIREIEILSCLRLKKKEIRAAEDEIKLVLNTIYTLQYEIMNSIEIYREIFSHLIRQNNELKQNLRYVRIIASENLINCKR